jgi:hypothetical protein
MPPEAKQVVWIASYPKSGNTWIRFLACNLVFGPIESASELASLAPDIHELAALTEPPGQYVLMKTHFRCSSALPLLDFTARAIYIVRDPVDVMVSNFHYALRAGASPRAVEAEFDAYVERFIAAGGDRRWVQQGMGGWEENVRSWIATKHRFPVLALRYEDVLADAAKTAQRLCEFLGMERTRQQMADAVAASSFERMREIEEADIRAQRVGIFYKPYLKDSITAGLRFMRRGGGGAEERALSEAQRLHFDAVFGKLRRQLGYR